MAVATRAARARRVVVELGGRWARVGRGSQHLVRAWSRTLWRRGRTAVASRIHRAPRSVWPDIRRSGAAGSLSRGRGARGAARAVAEAARAGEVLVGYVHPGHALPAGI